MTVNAPNDRQRPISPDAAVPMRLAGVDVPVEVVRHRATQVRSSSSRHIRSAAMTHG
jgi:hypothetical protein